jgi:hypothetical protein
MAYLTTLFSTSPQNIEAFRENPTAAIDVVRMEVCSHQIAAAVGAPPWGDLLSRALDGGEILHPDLKHPSLPPRFHDVAAVAALSLELSAAWKTAVAESLVDEDDLYGAQIGQIVALFHWAYEHNEAIVSFVGTFVE